MRPPIERYVRCSATRGAWTVEPGLEWREGDDFDELTDALRTLADMVAICVERTDDPFEPCRTLENTFAHDWPGRAFFIEVHDTDGRWTQTYQPYGVPMNR